MKMTMEHLEDKLTRISLDGRLDLEGTRAIDQQFAFATSTQPLKLAVDLSSVSFIASIGLRTLLTAARAQAGRGGRMVLVAPNEMVRKVLETSGIDSIVPILTTGLPTWVNAGHPGPALARAAASSASWKGRTACCSASIPPPRTRWGKRGCRRDPRCCSTLMKRD
jgi:anti-anti-sigma factor